MPDGYTICVMSSEPAVYNEFLYKSIPYDPEKDFQPIANLFFNTLSIVANSDLKVKSLAELIALAKTRQGLSYATFSFPLTVFMERLKKKENIDIVKVPYRGGGDVVNAVLGGTTPIALLALSNMVPQIQSGRITLLAVTSKSRSPLFPDAPTLKEALGEEYPDDLVRPVHAGRRAAADRREDRARRRPHHGRARVPQAHLYRPRRRARDGAARGVRTLRRSRAQVRGADRQGKRRAAEVAICSASFRGARHKRVHARLRRAKRANPESRAKQELSRVALDFG